MQSDNAKVIENKVKNIIPSIERREKGPYAVFECFQSIPCNPCYTSCKFNAVKPLVDINELPEVYYDKCTGCGVCITACPGLAVFVIDETFSENETLIRIPYEYMPLPNVNEVVDAVNRDGEVVGTAKIIKVQKFKNKTAVVSIAIKNELAQIVRGIKLDITKDNDKYDTNVNCETEGESIVCRCEDISLEEIIQLIKENKVSLNEIKLASRASMGPCQGKTCISLMLKEIFVATGIPINDLIGPRHRQPIKPIKIGSLTGIE